MMVFSLDGTHCTVLYIFFISMNDDFIDLKSGFNTTYDDTWPDLLNVMYDKNWPDLLCLSSIEWFISHFNCIKIHLISCSGIEDKSKQDGTGGGGDFSPRIKSGLSIIVIIFKFMADEVDIDSIFSFCKISTYYFVIKLWIYFEWQAEFYLLIWHKNVI